MFLHQGLLTLWGPAMESLGTGTNGGRPFLLFYLFTFLPLKALFYFFTFKSPFLLFYLFTFLPLKVNTEIELEGSIVGFVETVVADVGKTDVVGEIGIEHVVADAAADADTTIKAAEVCILE